LETNISRREGSMRNCYRRNSSESLHTRPLQSNRKFLTPVSFPVPSVGDASTKSPTRAEPPLVPTRRRMHNSGKALFELVRALATLIVRKTNQSNNEAVLVSAMVHLCQVA
jgi:hypothetical protein